MTIAGFIIAVVSIVLTVSIAVISVIYLSRLNKAYLAQTAVIIGRIGELEEIISRIGEGGYLLLQMLMEKGIITDEEMALAWKAYFEEPKENVREFSELLKEWKKKAGKEGILILDPSKNSH